MRFRVTRILYGSTQVQQQKNYLSEMKALAFCACVLALACFSSAETTGQRLKQALSIEDNFHICMTENNMTMKDWYREPNIINEEYTESGNEERKRKNGCSIACILQKEDLMVGSDIKENKIHAKISKYMNDNPMEPKVHKIARDCVRKVKDITEECEKSFSLFVCIMKAAHKASEHGEHVQE